MENSVDVIEAYLANERNLIESIVQDEKLKAEINSVVAVVCDSLRKGKKLIFAGNGGSAAEAQHMAGEYVSRFGFERPGLAGIAITTDTSILTAIGNDYGYAEVFSRQIQALGVEGDVLFGYTTSGTSKNIIKALEICKQKRITTVVMTGASAPEEIAADFIIRAPSSSTPNIQECHTIFGHLICKLVESIHFGKIVWKR